MDSFIRTDNFIKFMQILKTNILNLSTYNICELCHDVLLEFYSYKPKLGYGDTVVHMWENQTTREIITVGKIRIMCKRILNSLINVQNEYMVEIENYNSCEETEHDSEKTEKIEILKKKIKKIAELCIYIQDGNLYKEYIDCFRKGYMYA